MIVCPCIAENILERAKQTTHRQDLEFLEEDEREQNNKDNFLKKELMKWDRKLRFNAEFKMRIVIKAKRWLYAKSQVRFSVKAS